MKGFTRNKKFIPMTDYKKVRKSRDPEAKTHGIIVQRKARDASVRDRVNVNLDLLERFYIEKDVSLAERAHAIRDVKRQTGLDPRMFGNTDGDVLKGIRHIRSKVNTTRKQKTLPVGMKQWGFELTDFEPNSFEKILTNLGIKEGNVTDKLISVNEKMVRTGFIWSGDGITIITSNNPITGEYNQPERRPPEIGYAGYIGVQGESAKVDRAVKLIRDHIGIGTEESPNKREFI